MKKTLPILAIVFGILGIVGYGFKIMHWPGAGIMLVVSSAVMFVLLFIWFLMEKRSLFDICFFLFGLVFFAGYMFKMQHWPGGGILMGILPLVAIIMIIIRLANK